MSEDKIAKRFYVSGTVQGVGFRFFAQRVSMRLGLSGYVKNLRDGRVEVYAIGSAPQLDALRRDLEHGPNGASVSGVSDEDVALDSRYMHHFSIERDE